MILFARGIPTALLDSCETIIDEDGEEVLLDAEKRETFMKVLDECAISGRRGLGLASLTIPGVKGEKLKAIRKASSMEEAGGGWCLLGLLFFILVLASNKPYIWMSNHFFDLVDKERCCMVFFFVR